MKCTSRLSRSSFATRTGHFALRAAFSALAAAGGGRPLPCRASLEGLQEVIALGLRKAASAACCASSPRPERPWLAVETRV